MMVDGKKSVALNILYKSIKQGRKNLKLDKSSKLLVKAILNASPDLEIKTKKIGTNIYYIPRSITFENKIKYGIKNILQACNARKEHTMIEKLTGELTDAYKLKGLAIKKKDEIHKLAESNKSFSHFSW